MGSRETLLLALAIASAFLFLSTTGATETAFDADSWDMVVAFGNGIHFFKNDTEIRKFTVANLRDVTALAYDSVNRTLYISDGHVILHSSDLVDENLDSELTFHRISHTGYGAIRSMVFDPVTKALFWFQLRTLIKMEVASYGIDSSPKISRILYLTADTLPDDLTLDICHRFIYWTSIGDQEGSIERSRLDGTDRKEILSMESPRYLLGLTVDQYDEKLYFGISDRYRNFKIEESNSDGTDRRVLVNSSDNNVSEPSRLAVDDTSVYWAEDKGPATIWKVYRNGTAMRAIKTSSSQADLNPSPSNILTRHTVEGIDC